MNTSWGIHWFRRDLRVASNPALLWNHKKNQGNVLGFFCFDPFFLSRSDFSNNRFAFFLKTLEALQEEMRETGGDLLILDEGPELAFNRILLALRDKHIPLPSDISFNRDYEPFARQRDTKICSLLEKKFGILAHSERDHLLIEPHEIQKENSEKTGNTFYSVYGPFARKWFSQLEEPEIKQRIQFNTVGFQYLKLLKKNLSAPQLFRLKWKDVFGKHPVPQDSLDDYLTRSLKKSKIYLPTAGSLAALKALDTFQDHIGNYKLQRDFPAGPGTSKLSVFLKNGSLCSSQIIYFLNLYSESYENPSGSNQFLKELVWREFYYHILWHRPEVEKEAFQTSYRNIKWENDENKFRAWKEGKTGYPIVDAGMRELLTTGWMHNRVRMIAASFLVKDLLVDWRWGEEHFMKHLLDGDLAPNNGGWQWAASTGCDAQPYFRIFNPELQSRKFDPEGIYIRSYIPELKHLSNKEIHCPIKREAYPPQIVNHSEQRLKAIALFARSP